MSDSLSLRSAFITGASGFVGLQLAKRLRERGVSLRCLVRKTSRRDSLEKLGVEFVEGTVTDTDALRKGADGVDAVFHVAGLTRADSLDEFMAVNRNGCRSAAQAVADISRNGSPVLVSVSSLAAAGAGFVLPRSERRAAGVKYRRRLESDPPRPFSPYGKSKLAGEKELIPYAERIPITIVRPAFVFGEGDPLSFPLFKIAKHSPFFWIPGYRSLPFSYVYVQDLVSLLISAAEKGERITPSPYEDGGKGIYFASYPEDFSLRDFGRMLKNAVGRKKTLCPFYVPPGGLLGYAAVAELFKRFGAHVPLDWDKAREALTGPWICSSEKGAAHFGEQITASFQEELNRTARWYSENKGL